MHVRRQQAKDNERYMQQYSSQSGIDYSRRVVPRQTPRDPFSRRDRYSYGTRGEQYNVPSKYSYGVEPVARRFQGGRREHSGSRSRHSRVPRSRSRRRSPSRQRSRSRHNSRQRRSRSPFVGKSRSGSHRGASKRRISDISGTRENASQEQEPPLKQQRLVEPKAHQSKPVKQAIGVANTPLEVRKEKKVVKTVDVTREASTGNTPVTQKGGETEQVDTLQE